MVNVFTSISKNRVVEIARQVCIFLFIFLIPTQLARHYWPSWSYVHGMRVDYLSPSLNLIDLVGLCVVIVHGNDIIKMIRTRFASRFVFGLLLFALGNVIFSIQPYHTLYEWCVISIRVLSIYVVIHKWDTYKMTVLMGITSISILELVLVISQFILQSSVQGIWYALGERKLSLSLPEIAKIHINGREFLRPYGTFSHPNVMGGFFIALFFMLGSNKQNVRSGYENRVRRIIQFLCPILIFLSFSKVAIATFVLGNAVDMVKNTISTGSVVCKIVRLSVLVALCLIFLRFAGDPYTLEKRVVLVSNSIQILFERPLWGVGLGNYMIAQSTVPVSYKNIPIYQPVHNAPLLILTELGFVGVLCVYLFVRYVFHRVKITPSVTPLAVTLLITSMVDHYWITQSQTQILLILGIIYFLKKHDMTTRIEESMVKWPSTSDY